MSAAILWETFRSNPSTEDLFQPDCHIVFLPTGVGAASEKQVREFYKTGGYTHPKKLHVEERVIHRTVGETSAVDEVEVTVKFVTGSGGWLLPGIEPYHLEDLTITFPLVISASFVENHIASVRYFWDNASVLKMVKLIGSRHSWPIVTETQIDALREPSRFRLNPFGSVASAGGAASRTNSGISQIFNTPPTSPTPGTTGSAKQGHSISNVFSQQPVAQPQPSRTYKRTSHNIFGIPPEEQAKAKAEAEAKAAAAAAAATAQKQQILEPSAIIEAELERNEEFQRELKGDMTEEDCQQAALEALKEDIQTQEQLNAQQPNKGQKAPVQVKTPASVPIAPVSPPPQQPAVRIHPNFRSSFTIG